MLVISLPCLCVCHAWWTMGCSNDVVCGGLLVRWNQPTEPRSAQCEDRKWVHCSEGCLLPHCFSSPGLCGTVCTPAHTAAIMPPAVPFTQLWASVPEPAEFTQKGATLSQGPLHLWERPGLSHVPPPTWPKTGSRLKPAWMYTPLGSSEVGLLGSNFQPPCGISIHNLPTRGRDNDTQWLEVPFPQAEGLITAKLWVSSGGASSLIIRTMKAVGLAWHVARQNSVVRKGSLWPTYQRACMWVIGTRNTGSQVQHGQPGGRGQWTPRQKSRLSSCSHPLCVCRCDSLLALPLSLGSTRAALEAWSFRLSHNTYAVGW